jgi:hypothetical protein
MVSWICQESKAKGQLRGKPPKLSLKQEAHLVALHRAGEHTSAELTTNLVFVGGG